MADLTIRKCPFNCEYSKEYKQCCVDVSQVEGKTIYRVKCGCGACGPNADTMYEAIDAWNKRS